MALSTTLILIGIFILMEAFFSGSEIGMIAINRIKMKQKADEGNHSAQIVLNLLNTPERLFATTSLGTNLAVVSSTSIFTAYMVTHMGQHGELLAMVILSPIILFAGEIVPKMILQNRADAVMPFLIRPLNLSLALLSPIINFFTGMIPVDDLMFFIVSLNGNRLRIFHDMLKHLFLMLQQFFGFIKFLLKLKIMIFRMII